MTTLQIIDVGLLCLWMAVDSIVVFGRHARQARREDRLSTLGIVLATWVGLALATSITFAGIASPGSFTVATQIIGLIVLVSGIVIRTLAIAQLGRFHMPVVAIQTGHRVVDIGVYRHVRHPSYLGACVAYFGFGLGLGSWLGALALLAVVLVGYGYRIHVEERALLGSLGEEYAAYRRRTARLIPGVY